MRPTFAAALIAVLSAVTIPSEAGAQVTLAAVAPDLPAGHRTELTVDGRPLAGDLVRATADGVVLWRYDTGATEEIAAARVSKVVYDDSLLNGALIGTLIGAVPGFVVGIPVQQYCQNEVASRAACASVPFKVAGVTGLLGLGVGAAIDGALKTTVRILPSRPSTASATVSVSPDRRRPMALVTVTF